MGLSGAELLARVKELGDVPKAELARACGYVSTRKDGSERLNFTAFYDALLKAKGISLGEPHEPRRRGRTLSYHTKVQFNGNLMVGSAYTAMLGFQPGDEFEIQLGRRQIRLVAVNGDETGE